MTQQIAGNTQHGGRRNRGYAESWTSEQLDQLLSEAWLKQMVADIRAGDEKQKDQLPYICPHYAAFKNNHRAQKDIMPETFTYMTCVDVDDKELVDKAIRRAMELNEDAYSDWQDQVLRIEYSARKKVHIYIRIPKGMTIEEAQQAFCAEVDIPYDENCITPERFIYVTGKDEEVYRSPHWLEPLSDEEQEERREAYLQRGLDVDGRRMRKLEGRSKKDDGRCKMDDGRCKMDDVSPEASTLDSRNLVAFDLCAKQAGLDPDAMDVWGEHNWHSNLMAVLSVGVGKLMNRGQLYAVVAQRLPNYSDTEDCRKLIDYFYEKYDADKGFMNASLREINAKAQQEVAQKDGEATLQTLVETPLENCKLSQLFNSKRPPELPAVLPKLVKAVTRNTPQKYKATVAQAMFPPLGAYPKGLSFRYIDNQVRELRINCLIVAETGAGKDSCTRQPLTHIIADMKDRDRVNRERLKKFNDEYNSKAGNKQKPQRPDDLVIQNIKSDITKAALVQRTEEANGAPLYVRINELEQWDKIEGCSGRSNQFTTLKLCDDEGNDFGSDRASTQSVTGDGCLHLNWNANTTVAKLMRYFRHVLTDGPVSRLTLATVPEEEVGADIPVFGNYDKAYDEALKPYIDNLKAATGVIDCPQARRLARQLKDECAEFACLSADDVFDNLTHRALVMAFRKACLLYVANGMKWEKSIETFCRWSLFYDMYLKMKLFGDLIRHANGDMSTSKRGPRSLLEDLPDKFTIDDAKRIRQQQGLSNEGYQAIRMIRTWINRHRVIQNTEYSFEKVGAVLKVSQND